MLIRRLPGWPTNWRPYTVGRRQNWRGPRRALTVEEQLEIQRAIRTARLAGKSVHTGHELARRYGVSARTIWRYVDTVPVPPGLEFLRMRLADWQRERDLNLTLDDMTTLLNVIARHRDQHPAAVPVPVDLW